MLTLNDGRSELWQWDTKRKLTVDADCSQVHFSNKILGRSIDVDVVNGIATIPDILLQTDKELNAWAFVGTAENGYTKISKTFKVNKRNKPADYVFTPLDQTTLQKIEEKIKYLESIQDQINDDLSALQACIETKQSRYTIKTVMDSVAEPHTQYYLGEQAAVEIALPDTADVGQIIFVSWYNGDTAATLSITGTMLDFEYTPSANTRSEINALWDGTYWAVIGNEILIPSAKVMTDA